MGLNLHKVLGHKGSKALHSIGRWAPKALIPGYLPGKFTLDAIKSGLRRAQKSFDHLNSAGSLRSAASDYGSYRVSTGYKLDTKYRSLAELSKMGRA